MKIGIIGTRGIPNQYGGFEQFAEFVAPELVRRGHEVVVYSSSLHPYGQSTWKGVRIVKRYDPENKIGTFGQFVYDFNCILHARKENFDVLLQLGYTSSSIWTFLYPKQPVLVTNMDGLEWKRAKYPGPVRFFLKYAEKWAALYSDALIADSKGIRAYLEEKYHKSSQFIPYGAGPVRHTSEAVPAQFGLKQYGYNLIIARMEPENNIEPVIRGTLNARVPVPLVIAGNHHNRYGKYLRATYASPAIQFIGPIYDIEILNSLRFYSNLYFHGHSVGGTNPSLLEAMASGALVVANDNIFNRSVLEEDGFYFSTENDITRLLNSRVNKTDYSAFLNNNRQKIEQFYSWDHIASQLENYLTEVLAQYRRN